MISTHFPQSQFIIISLKEGMFNNANVLYKISFVDGNSKVDRNAIKANLKKKKEKIQSTKMEILDKTDLENKN